MEEIAEGPTTLRKKGKRTLRGVIFFEICDEEIRASHDVETTGRLFSSDMVPIFQGTSSHPLRFSFFEDKSRIMADISEVHSCFDDPQDRQIRVSKLKKSISTLMNKLGSESRVLLRVLFVALDALKNTPSEHLNEEQIDTMKFVLDMIDKDLDDKEVDNLQQILINSGLNPIPEMEGIAELYQ